MNFEKSNWVIFNFFMCDFFSKKDNVSVCKWFKKLKWKLQIYVDEKENILSDQFFHVVDFFFIDETSNWTEIDSHIVNFFQNLIFTQNSILFFKKKFQKRFFFKSTKLCSVNFNSELQNLKQKSNESLIVYYKRIFDMMQRMNVKNKFSQKNEILFFWKRSCLITFWNSFLKIYTMKMWSEKSQKFWHFRIDFFVKCMSWRKNWNESNRSFKNCKTKKINRKSLLISYCIQPS